MPILKITYYGYFIAQCVISVMGNGSTSGVALSLATKYVAKTVSAETIAPIKGKALALKP